MRKISAVLISICMMLITVLPLSAHSYTLPEVPYGEPGPFSEDEIVTEVLDVPVLGVIEGLPEKVFVRYPANATGPLPTIFYFHSLGGGGEALNPNDEFYDSQLIHLASRGYAVVFATVSVRPESHLLLHLWIPYAYQTWKRGILTAVEQFGHKMDLDKIGVIGYSLGGGAAPYMTKELVERGWGSEGLFLHQIAPWYVWHMNTFQLHNLPAHTKYMASVTSGDGANSHRMAIDIFEHLNLPLSEREYIKFGCAEHGDIYFQPAIIRHQDALADYAFEGADFGRLVALGIDQNGNIDRSEQLQVIEECPVAAMDNPVEQGEGEKENVAPLDLSDLGIDQEIDFFYTIGGWSNFFIIPAPIWINPRWYPWKLYWYLRDHIIAVINFFLQFIGLTYDDLLSGFSGDPFTFFNANMGVSLPKVVVVPQIGWCPFCIPEVAFGPIDFNPVSVSTSLETLAIGDFNEGELSIDGDEENPLITAAARSGSYNFDMQDIDVGIRIRSNVLGINAIVSAILDFLGLDEIFDALDGNFDANIDIDSINLPFDFSSQRGQYGGVVTSVVPSLFSDKLVQDIRVPQIFNTFGFGLPQKIVNGVTGGINNAKDSILRRIFGNIQENVFEPAFDSMEAPTEAVFEAVAINIEPEPEPDENCIDFGSLLGVVCLPFLTPFP